MAVSQHLAQRIDLRRVLPVVSLSTGRSPLSRARKLTPVTDLALIAGAGALVVLTLSKACVCPRRTAPCPLESTSRPINAIGDALAKWTWR